ncbi:MAG TPA: S49 family peptidase [Pyrinomonadaceae bacterium]|nr:S49 family peptidase [Pyrinomonadaceae bacterium]
MSEAKPGPLRRLWNGFWGIVDGTRRGLFNAIFLVFVIFVVFALFGWGAPKTEPGTALMLAPKGAIVEQYSADPGDRVIAKLTGDEILEVQLRDVLRALEAAKSDPNIDLVVVRTEQFAGAGLATLREIGRAMKQVREAGKEIIAYGDYFDQRGYYLAAHADKIYLSPNGGVLLQGLGRYRSYYAALLDKLKVDIHVFRVGTYKSAVEPYLLNGPSEAAREADQAWLDDLWQIYLADVSEARKLEPGFISRWIERLPELVESSGGDMAKLALDSGLVDELLNEDEFEKLLAERGSVDPQTKRARRVGVVTYAERQSKQLMPGDAVVGVIVAEGSFDKEEVVIGEVDPARIEEVRRGWPFLRDRRIDAYSEIEKRFVD